MRKRSFFSQPCTVFGQIKMLCRFRQRMLHIIFKTVPIPEIGAFPAFDSSQRAVQFIVSLFCQIELFRIACAFLKQNTGRYRLMYTNKITSGSGKHKRVIIVIKNSDNCADFIRAKD